MQNKNEANLLPEQVRHLTLEALRREDRRRRPDSPEHLRSAHVAAGHNPQEEEPAGEGPWVEPERAAPEEEPVRQEEPTRGQEPARGEIEESTDRDRGSQGNCLEGNTSQSTPENWISEATTSKGTIKNDPLLPPPRRRPRQKFSATATDLRNRVVQAGADGIVEEEPVSERTGGRTPQRCGSPCTPRREKKRCKRGRERSEPRTKPKQEQETLRTLDRNEMIHTFSLGLETFEQRDPYLVRRRHDEK